MWPDASPIILGLSGRLGSYRRSLLYQLTAQMSAEWGDQMGDDVRGKDGYEGDSVASGHDRVIRSGGFIKEERGRVDRQGNVDANRPMFGHERVGHVAGNRARGRDGVLTGEEWGYVDDSGDVHQRDGIFTGRVIGQARGHDHAAALAHFMLRFDHFVQDFRQKFDSEERISKQLSLVRWTLGKLPDLDALGDFGSFEGELRRHEKDILGEMQRNRYTRLGLIDRVEKLTYPSNWREASEEVKSIQAEWKDAGPVAPEDYDSVHDRYKSALDSFYRERDRHYQKIQSERDENLRAKLRLCDHAESLSSSTDWKGTGEEFKRLQEEWKGIGHVPKDQADAVWQRFQSARETFYTRRGEHFEEVDRERRDNAYRKRALCEEAERLAYSDDWKGAGDRLKESMDEWKSIGRAPRDEEDSLWERFSSARNEFFDRRKAHYEELDRQRAESKWAKERVIDEVESLYHSSDYRAAKDRVKELQAGWRDLGRASREDEDDLWERFRAACDRVFEAAAEDRERRLQEVLDRKREQAASLEESIAHDEGLIDHWEDVINGLGDGGRADEIRASMEEKIDSVGDKVRSKKDRIEELHEAIRDIESKMR